MKKIAVIDLGTNSMRMLISKIESNKIIQSYKAVQTTRLGQGIVEGKIASSAFLRNFNALKLFKEQAEKEKVEKILVFGTSALRDASNANDFVQKVKAELELSIKILSGKQEAEMGFMGVVNDICQDALIIDIGGGSTELITGNKDKGITDAISMNIGAVRITQTHIKNDPIKKHEVIRVQKDLQDQLKEIAARFSFQKSKDIIAIGIGGTITTLSAIKQNMAAYDGEKIHLSTLSQKDVTDLFKRLSSLNLEERKKIVGLQPGRADIIIAGIIILEGIMKILEVENLIVSDHDNLEGMLYHDLEINKHKRD